MSKVITYDFSDNFVDKISEFVRDDFLRRNNNLTRLALVFEGKRPTFFVKQKLAREFGKGFFPPTFFSIDEFVEYIVSKDKNFSKKAVLNSYFSIYNLARKICPGILKGREGFSQFLPWAREIEIFINELDLEGIPNNNLSNLKLNGAIGYGIPPSINSLLNNIVSIRRKYHNEMEKNKTYSKGKIYHEAMKVVDKISLDEFDEIVFCNILCHYKTERGIIKNIYEKRNTYLLFQGDQEDWPLLAEIAKDFSCKIKPGKKSKIKSNFTTYAGFDAHSQVCLVREYLKRIKDPDNAVIVLPDPHNLVPLLSEIEPFADKLNVSVGYPLNRSSIYTLIESIFKAQHTKKGNAYYTKDYLKVITQPFVKNLNIQSDCTVTRILVHKIEEALLGIENAGLEGSVFLELEDIKKSNDILASTLNNLRELKIEIDFAKLKETVDTIHGLLFYSWEGMSNFDQFSRNLEKLLDTLVDNNLLDNYPIDLAITRKILAIAEEFKNSMLNKEIFSSEDMFKILENLLRGEKVAFSGSPLQGLQVLGLFETRLLSFENVIVMDLNEAILPKTRIYEPLIPREVMLSLGLSRPEREEEIQRYQFKRLIASAKNVCFIYESNKNKEKSRFLEELIWEKQKQKRSLDAMPVLCGRYLTQIPLKRAEVKKTKKVINFLQNDFEYSATSVDTYLKCPLMFYFKYVLRLREKENLLEDIEGRAIGIFIHELLCETFKRFEGQKIYIDKKFKKEFFSILDKKFSRELSKRMKTNAFILREVVQHRLKQFLDKEEERGQADVAKLLCVEKEFKGNIDISGKSYKFTAKVDRIDRLRNGDTLIIDYKTGGEAPLPKGIDKIQSMQMTRESIKDTIKSFQLPLYLYLVQESGFSDSRGANINATLYYLRTSEIKEFLRKDAFSSIEDVVNVFMQALKYILLEITNPEQNFVADTQSTHFCKNCSYFYMCR